MNPSDRLRARATAPLAAWIKGHEDEVDRVAEDAADRLERAAEVFIQAFQAALADPIAKVKILRVEGSTSSWNSWEHENSRYSTTYYFARVEHPESLVLTRSIRFDLAPRWSKALASVGLPASISIPVRLLARLTEAANEAIHNGMPDRLWDDSEMEVETELYSQGKLATEAKSSETRDTGQENEHRDTWGVDARFEYRVGNAEVEGTTEPGDKLLIRWTVPVQVLFKRIVSPWDNDYMRPR